MGPALLLCCVQGRSEQASLRSPSSEARLGRGGTGRTARRKGRSISQERVSRDGQGEEVAPLWWEELSEQGTWWGCEWQSQAGGDLGGDALQERRPQEQGPEVGAGLASEVEAVKGTIPPASPGYVETPGHLQSFLSTISGSRELVV